MHLLFVVIALAGLGYFLFAPRRFDCFAVGYFSACVYFLPGFLGYAHLPNPVDSSRPFPVDLADETYLVMATVLAGLALGALAYDLAVGRREPAVALPAGRYAGHVACGLALFGLVMCVLTMGDSLLADDKQEVLDRLNRWYILWEVATGLAVTLAFAQRRWWLLAACLPLVLANVYVGFRLLLALCLIATCTLALVRRGPQVLLLRNKRALTALLLGCLVLFVYKGIFVHVKMGNWDTVRERLTDPDYYVSSVTQSEPFTTQVILDSVLVRRFHVEPEHLVRSVTVQFVLFSPELGVESAPDFNADFQSALFPGLNWGMAGNIWAEMHATGGWPLFVIFLLLFVLLLALGSYAVRARDPVVQAFAALFFSYLAFYIHRNTLTYQLCLQKRLLLVGLACFVVSAVVHSVVTYRPGGAALPRRLAVPGRG
jgi:hypothetical protein